MASFSGSILLITHFLSLIFNLLIINAQIFIAFNSWHIFGEITCLAQACKFIPNRYEKQFANQFVPLKTYIFNCVKDHLINCWGIWISCNSGYINLINLFNRGKMKGGRHPIFKGLQQPQYKKLNQITQIKLPKLSCGITRWWR